MFSFLKPKEATMNVRKIDDNFAVTGQITPEQVKAVADAGFKSIVCARPDNEEHGQPASTTSPAPPRRLAQDRPHPVSGGLGEGR